jgi:hypothetical protein
LFRFIHSPSRFPVHILRSPSSPARHRHDNALLIRETHCLERFWERQEHVFSENQGALPQSALKEMGGGGRRRRSRPSRQMLANQIRTAPMELTDAQKGDIAQRDLEFMQTNYER